MEDEARFNNQIFRSSTHAYLGQLLTYIERAEKYDPEHAEGVIFLCRLLKELDAERKGVADAK
jgi:hypothetical protein